MIEIDEPPDVRACATCARPLVWLWSLRKQRWVAFVTVPVPDTLLLRVHECPRFGPSSRSWRDVVPQRPGTARVGAARVRRVLQAKEIN